MRNFTQSIHSFRFLSLIAFVLFGAIKGNAQNPVNGVTPTNAAGSVTFTNFTYNPNTSNTDRLVIFATTSSATPPTLVDSSPGPGDDPTTAAAPWNTATTVFTSAPTYSGSFKIVYNSASLLTASSTTITGLSNGTLYYFYAYTWRSSNGQWSDPGSSGGAGDPLSLGSLFTTTLTKVTTGVSTSIVGGDTDKALVGFSASTNGSDEFNGDMVFTLSIDPTVTTKLKNFRLYNYGTTSTYAGVGGGTQIGGAPTLASGPKTITFNIATTTAIQSVDGSNVYFFLVADADVAAPTGTVTTTLTSAALNQGSTSGTGLNQAGTTITALNAPLAKVTGGVATAVVGGNTDKALIGFSASTNGSQEFKNNMVFTLSVDPTVTTNLKNFRLYNYGATNTYAGVGGGTQIGGVATLNSGAKTVTFSVATTTAVLSGSNSYYFLVADVDPTAPTGTVTTTLTSAAVNQGNTSGSGFSQSGTTITALNATLTKVTTGVATTLAAGNNDRAIIGFSASTNGAQELNGNIVFTLDIDPTITTNLKNFRLYNYGATATYTNVAGGTQIGGAASLNSGTKTVTFTIATSTAVLSGSNSYYFLVADVDPAAPAGNVTATLTSAAVDQGTTSGQGFSQGPTPITALTATLAKVTGGVSTSLVATNTDKALIGFSASTSGSQELKGNIVFTLDVDPTVTTNLKNFRLYNYGATATYTNVAGGTQIGGVASLNSGAKTITFNIATTTAVLSGSLSYYFLVADVDPAAPTGNVTTTLTSAAVDQGAVTGPTFNQGPTSITALSATLTKVTTGVATSLVGSNTDKALIGFRATTNGTQELKGSIVFTLDVDPTVTTNLKNFRLYNYGATSTYTNVAGGTQIGGAASLNSGAKTVTFNIATTTAILSGSNSYYFLVADVDPAAPTGNVTTTLTSAAVDQGAVTGPTFSQGPTSVTTLTATLTKVTGGVAASLFGSNTDKALIGFSASTNGIQQLNGNVVFTLNVDPTVTTNLKNFRLYNYGATSTYTNVAGGTLIGGAASLNSGAKTVTFNIATSTAVLSGANSYYFLVADVDPSAPTGSVTTTLTSATVDQGTTTGPTFSQGPTAVTALTATLTKVTGGVAASLIGSNADKALIGFSASTNGSQELKGNIVFTLNVDPTVTTNLKNFRLYNYGATSTYTNVAGGTLIGGAASLNSGAKTVTFNIATSTAVLSGANSYYFLVADVDPAAPTGTVTTTLTSAAVDQGLTAGPTFSQGPTSITALTATLTKVTGGVATSLVGSNTDKALVGFSASTNGTQELKGSIVFTLSVDPTVTTNLKNFRLYNYGATSSYTNVAGGTQIGGVATLNSGAKTVTFNIATTTAVLSGANSYYFLVADIDPAAPTGTVNTTVTSAAVDQGTTSGPPFSQNGTTITALTTTLAQQAFAASYVGGNTSKAFIGYDATTNGAQSLSQVVFTLNVDPTDATILSNYKLINNGAASVYSGGGSAVTATVGLVGGASKTVTFNITGGASLSGSNTYFFMVADISTAIASSTINTVLTSAATNPVGAGGVTGAGFNQNATIAQLTATLTAIASGTAPVTALSTLTAGAPSVYLNGFSVSSNGSQSISAIDFNMTGLAAQFSSLSLFKATAAGAGGALVTTSATGNFTGLAQTVNTGTTNYYYLVGNVATNVTTLTATVNVAPTEANVTLSPNNKNSFSINKTFDFQPSQASNIILNAGTSGNIAYGGFQTASGLTTGNSENLATFRIQDGGGAADADVLTTTLTRLDLNIPNFANLRAIALFTGGPSAVAEITTIGGSGISFTGLSLVAPDDGHLDITVRATFNTIVSDNQNIHMAITRADASTAGSNFPTVAAGGANTGAATTVNKIIVTATTIQMLPPATIIATQNFGLPVNAVDANGSIDVDKVSTVTLTKFSSAPASGGVLNPTNPSGVLVAGSTTITFKVDLASYYTVNASDGTLTGQQTFLAKSIGVLISGPTLSLCYQSAYQPLGAITITERDATDFNLGTNETYSFILPAGYSFDQSITTATPSSTLGTDLTGFTPITYVSSNIAQFKYSVPTVNTLDNLVISGLAVRYDGTTNAASASILRFGGGATQAGNSPDDALVHGTLSASSALPVIISTVSYQGPTFLVTPTGSGSSVKPTDTQFSITEPPIVLNGFMDQNTANVTIDATHPDNMLAVSGVFSGVGVLQDAFGNYKFYPGSVAAGNYTVTFTFTMAGAQACKAIVQKTFTVFSATITGFTTNQTLCIDALTAPLTLSAGVLPSDTYTSFCTGTPNLPFYSYYNIASGNTKSPLYYFNFNIGDWVLLPQGAGPNEYVLDLNDPNYNTNSVSFSGGVYIGYPIYENYYDDYYSFFYNACLGNPFGPFFYYTYQFVPVNFPPVIDFTPLGPECSYFMPGTSSVALFKPTGTTALASNGYDQFYIKDPTDATLIAGAAVAPLTGANTDPTFYALDPSVALGSSTTDLLVMSHLKFKDPNTGCVNDVKHSVRVIPKPTAIISGNVSNIGPYCEGSPITPVQLSGSFGSDKFRWYTIYTGPGIPTNDLRGTGPNFLPPVNNSIPGATTFKVVRVTDDVVVAGFVGCDSDPYSFAVNIDPKPVVTLVSNPPAFCASTKVDLTQLASYLSGSPAITFTPVAGLPQPMKGTWTSVSGGTFEDHFGAGTGSPNFDVASLTPAVNYNLVQADKDAGSVVLRLTSENPANPPFNSSCPVQFAEVVVPINQVATVTPGPDQTLCIGSNVKPRVYDYDLVGARGGSASAFTWTTLGGGTINNAGTNLASYSLSPAEQAATSNFNLTFTITSDDPVGPCQAVQLSKTYTFHPPALVNAGVDQAICSATGVISLNGSIGAPASSSTWSNDGTGSFSDPTQLNANYLPSVSELTNGATVNLDLLTNDPDGSGPTGPCNAEDDKMVITIYPTPAAPLAIPPSPYCINDAVKNLVASGTVGAVIKWYSDAGLTAQVGVGGSFPTGILADATKTVDFYVTQTPASNCQSLASIATIVVNPLPVPAFTADKFCFNDLMQFTDASTIDKTGNAARTISLWGWEFQDGDIFAPGSGTVPAGVFNDRTTNTYDKPFHKYAGAGSYDVKLTVVSSDNCSNSVSASQITTNPVFTGAIRVGSLLSPDFDFSHICDQDVTQFVYINSSAPGVAVPAAYDWDFGDGSAHGTAAAPSHTYPSVGNNSVSLTVTTDLNCAASITKPLNILPYVKTFPYNEGFEGAHGWFTESVATAGNPTALTSWQVTSPNGLIINSAASGSKAWITNANGGNTYYNDERSVLNGPCLDMTQLQRPVISFKYWDNTDQGSDGTYVETSIDGGITWQKLPSAGAGGLNWYDRSSVSGLAQQNGIGQTIGQEGWSGLTPTWTPGKFNMDNFKANTQVRVRFVFGSNPDNPAVDTLNGFALDDFAMENRNRTLLAENFTNAAADNGNTNSINFLNFQNTVTTNELVKIEYHTGIGGADSFYQHDQADGDARAAFYGVTNSFQGFISGTSGGAFAASGGWAATTYDVESLVTAPLDLSIVTPATPADQFNAQVTVNTNQDLPSGQYVIQLAVIESVGTNDQYVLRKLLPNAAGTPLTALTKNSTQTTDVYSWNMVNVADPTKLAVVAFVQDQLEVNKKWVVQATLVSNPTVPATITGIKEPITLEMVAVYPNPANTEFSIEFPSPAKEQVNLKVWDQVGKLVHESFIAPGGNNAKINTRDWATGLYILQMDSGNKDEIFRRKVMVVHGEGH